MTVLYIIALIAGLLLAVRAMLLGVERRPADPLAGIPGLVSASPVALAASAIVFGIIGYLLGRPARLGTGGGLAAAAVGAVLAWAGAVVLVRRARRFVPEHDPDDPRYLLQGHVALVTARIDGAKLGEISYELDGRRYVSPAAGLEGSSAEAGSEVVIERIDDGVAHVEPWAAIEERL
jgi:membrane protein implicated in regulation of membrane protease activity